MFNVAVLALLAVLQPSAPAQLQITGQACTARELIGTWQLASKPSTPGVIRALKHVTPTHFVVLRLGANDVVQTGHGGPYTLAGGTYTETLEYGFGPQFEQYRGVSVPFQCRLDG